MKRSRFLARIIDYSLFFTLLTFFTTTLLSNIVLFFSIPLLFAPIEGLFYAFFKTTPGKWIFGITLSKRLNLFLSLKLAFKKAFLILPLLFPPLNIIFLLFYLKERKEHKENRWSEFCNTKVIQKNRNSIFKYTLLLATIFSLVIAYTPISFTKKIVNTAKNELFFDSWVEVKDNDLNFSVYFPMAPTILKKEVVVEEQNTTLDVTEYHHSDAVTYSLVSTKVPSSWTFLGSNYLLKSLGKQIEKHQGKIAESKMVKHGTHPAMSYLLQNHAGGQTKGILILVKKMVYKLEVTTKKDLSEEELELSQNFISSFDIN